MSSKKKTPRDKEEKQPPLELAELLKKSIGIHGPSLPPLRLSPGHLREEENKALIKRALEGDTSSAKEILERFCEGVKHGQSRGNLIINPMEIPAPVIEYLADCFKSILNNVEADKALNLKSTTAGRRRTPLGEKMQIFMKIYKKVNPDPEDTQEEPMQIKAAIIEVAKQEKQKEETIRKIWEEVSRRCKGSA